MPVKIPPDDAHVNAVCAAAVDVISDMIASPSPEQWVTLARLPHSDLESCPCGVHVRSPAPRCRCVRSENCTTISGRKAFPARARARRHELLGCTRISIRAAACDGTRCKEAVVRQPCAQLALHERLVHEIRPPHRPLSRSRPVASTHFRRRDNVKFCNEFALLDFAVAGWRRRGRGCWEGRASCGGRASCRGLPWPVHLDLKTSGLHLDLVPSSELYLTSADHRFRRHSASVLLLAVCPHLALSPH